MMTKDNNAIDNRYESTDLDQADCGNAERRVALAFGTLRLLIDKDDPPSLRETIVHARQMAENYVHWEQSGALIKDVAVRLSDGQEIAVDQSNIASVCGLRFRNAFMPNAVLHIWKKADKQFGEVQLLSLTLQDVRANGFNYKKTYQNGQTLFLRIARCLDGQFEISVDYTEKERAMMMPSRHSGWLVALGSATVCALLKLRFLLSSTHPRPRRSFLSTAALITVLVFAAVGCGLAMHSLWNVIGSIKSITVRSQAPSSGQTTPVQHNSASPTTDTSNVEQAMASNEAQSSIVKGRITMPEQASKGNQLQKIGLKDESGTILPKDAHRVSSMAATKSGSVFDLDKEGQARLTAWPFDSRKPASWDLKRVAQSQTEVTGDEQTIIYVRTDSKDHHVSDEDLRTITVSALEHTNYFFVMTEDKVPKQGDLTLDIRLAQKKDAHGVLLAELYDDQGQLLWNGDQNCSEAAFGPHLEVATQQLVAEMLSTMTSSQAEKANHK
jgi:hypothetical protein